MKTINVDMNLNQQLKHLIWLNDYSEKQFFSIFFVSEIWTGTGLIIRLLNYNNCYKLAFNLYIASYSFDSI